MTRIRIFSPLALLFFASALHAQYTDQINANRPGQSQSAFAVGKTIMQVETGVYGIYEKHDILNYEAYGGGGELTLRYGAFLEELEFEGNIKYQFDQYSDALYTYTRNNLKELGLGAKYLIYDPDKNYDPKPNLYSWKANHRFKWHTLIPAVAAYGGVNLMSGGSNPYTFPQDKTSFKVMAITQNHFGRWVWVNNFIADKISTDYPSYGWTTTFTRGFNKTWSGMMEFQGFSSDYYADGIFRLGAAHLLGHDYNMQVDASVSTNFKNTPYIATGVIGFSWRFDAKYSDVLLAGKGDHEDQYNEDQKKKEKEKKKRKEEREKKRLDQVVPDGGK